MATAAIEWANPDDPLPQNPAKDRRIRPCSRSGNGSTVAAGPSTCGDVDSRRHHRTTGEPGQGVDGRLLCPVTSQKPRPCLRWNRRLRATAAAKSLWCKCMKSSGADGTLDAATGRNPTGHRRPRPHGAKGFCQSGGVPRLHRALSDRGRPARPSRRIHLWPPRLADHARAAGRADGAGRPAMRRRRHRAVGPCRDLHHPARGDRRPAIIFSSATTSIARRAISATACWRATASRPPISIRMIGAGIEKLFKPNTRAVLVEAPGSQSFEMPDIPAIAARRACARRAGDRRQHLGDAAVSPLARARRRHQHAGRHQIYRRPFRHHVRHHLGQREGLAA